MSTKTVSKGITRFEFDNRKGYMVRISRDGQRVSSYFSDSRLGGKRKALAAAKEAYESMLQQYGPAHKGTHGRLTSRNTTGVVGVHLAYTQDNRYPSCEYYAYCASWITEDGKRQKASFAWNKYGEDNSLELAKIAREREITDRNEVVAIFESTTGRKAEAGESPVKATKKASKKASKKAVKKATKKSVKKSAKKSVKKAAKKPVKKAAKKSLKKVAKKPAKKTAKKASKKSTKKAAKKSSKKAAKKSVKKTAKKPVKKRR